jgi:hypothetical protein
METDIRNTEIKIKVRQSEGCLEAIGRYMKKIGFERREWTDNKGLDHQYFTRCDYSEIWISYYAMNEKNNTCLFNLAGNL